MRAAIALVVLAIGCKDDRRAPAGAAIAIFVDNTQVASVPVDQVKLWPRVDTLVPAPARRLATWNHVRLTTAGSPIDLDRLATTYPELVPALFPDAGAVGFGMFAPVALSHHEPPAIVFHGIREVRIGTGQNAAAQDDAGETGPLQLAIKTKTGEHMLTAEALRDIPREPAPGGDGEAKGWKLSRVLAAAGVTTYERVLLTDAKGATVTLEKADLDELNAIPFVKLNRQGSLRFRELHKQGDAWQSTADLRGLVRIEVLR